MTTLLDHPLSTGLAPVWASEWGEDRFGVFATLQVGEVTQKLRFIPPGSFFMGSPEEEEGRWDDEGPRHLVTLTEGFWLADTPCTQGFWQEVMGENPSGSKGLRRPVERVSWEDAQRFLRHLEAEVPGCKALLPSEAQWEYACRAGATSSSYGDLEEIAWYSANSGGSTHEVGLKRANSWGLFDILGNVWEWCEDFWSDRYEAGQQRDPTGPELGSSRVYRGGSWLFDAGYVRAACRHWFEPGIRDVYLGFRFSLGQLRSGQGAERGK